MKENQGSEGTEKDVPTKQLKMVGQLKPHRGHTLFKYRVETGQLTPILKGEVNPMRPNKRIVLAEEGCLYVTALNLKNAIKKIAIQFNITVNE
jgi:hypothetical protein